MIRHARRPSHTYVEPPLEATDGDNRIMLQILLSEARRFHADRRSMRTPLTPSRPALGSPQFDPANASVSSDVSIRSHGSNASTGSNASDGWTDLQYQIDEAWQVPTECPAAVRYQRIKSYLTWMFIWDPSREWVEFDEASPTASLQWITERQVARLNQLAPGSLFLPPPMQQS